MPQVGLCPQRQEVLLGAGLQLRGSAALRAMPLHVHHFSMKPFPKPCSQPFFGRGKIDIRKADFLEAEFTAPAPNVFGKQGRVRFLGPLWHRVDRP